MGKESDKYRKLIAKAEDQIVDLEREISELTIKLKVSDEKGDFNKAAKLKNKIDSKRRNIAYTKQRIESFNVELRKAELEEQQDQLRYIIKEIDSRVPKALELNMRELKHSLSSAGSVAMKIWMLRNWYNNKAGEAKKLDSEVAKKLLSPYESFDWNFGIGQLLRWEGEIATRVITRGGDSPITAEFRLKRDRHIEAKARQISDVVKAVKGRKRR